MSAKPKVGRAVLSPPSATSPKSGAVRTPRPTILREEPTPYRTAADSSPSPPGGERGEVGQGTALRFIDLFCGIGGFRLAFERAGAKCVFSSDWDKFSRQTYAANFGEPPHGEIHSVAATPSEKSRRDAPKEIQNQATPHHRANTAAGPHRHRSSRRRCAAKAPPSVAARAAVAACRRRQ